MDHLSKSHKKFVKIFLLILSPLVFLTLGINYIIDPFLIHETPVIAKLNENKVSLNTHGRLHQAIEIARKKPQVILLGSSRVKDGLNVEDMKAIIGQETYNAAFSGATFEEIYHYFEHALYHQPDLKVVVIGLDFCAFNQYLRPTADFCLDRLKTEPITWRDFNASLLSLQALRASFQTFKASFFSNISPLVEEAIAIKGDLSFLKMTLKADYKSYKNDQKKIEMFRQLVEKCQERSIVLKAFFCPMQAIYWEAIYRSNLWPSFEELKKELSLIYPVWDFSGFNCVTTRFLEQEIKEPLYYECSHFRPIVGKMIGEKMFHQKETPSDFGFFLTSETIGTALEKMEEQAHNWLETHDNIMEQIERAKDW